MPKKAPYRRIDKYWNEKQLAREFGSGLNDVIGRGTIAGGLGSLGDLAGLGENGIRALLGLPQVEPWGGSEHIGRGLEKAGLVSSVRRPKTELLTSLVSPAGVAKTVLNAPKTARNALTALTRLDDMSLPMPRARQGQLGAIDVWHGSPHKFDTFKAMDNIGGGEGAQAYGHGGYHASNPEVAQGYADKLAFKKPDAINSKVDEVVDDLNYHNGDIDSVRGRYQGMIDSGNPESARYGKEKMDLLDNVVSQEKKSNLYRNQLRWPDPAREAADPLSDKHFLDWDKPLSEQDASVQALLPDFSGLDRPVTSLQGRIRLPDGSFADSEQQLSRALSARGIPGIRYLDGGSRSAGQGSHNYVTFDDALVNILERNGQPVGNIAKMVAPQDEALRVAQANAAKPVSEGGLGLRLDNTPEERAAAMGFVNDAYHGSYADIETIDPAKFSDRVDYMKGFFTAHSPETAGNYGDTVYPLLQRNGVQVADRRLARLEGREAPALDTVFDPVRGINVTNNPANIRSRFAAFDPMRKDSSDLLAGLAPIGLGALIAQPKEKKKPKK